MSDHKATPAHKFAAEIARLLFLEGFGSVQITIDLSDVRLLARREAVEGRYTFSRLKIEATNVEPTMLARDAIARILGTPPGAT